MKVLCLILDFADPRQQNGKKWKWGKEKWEALGSDTWPCWRLLHHEPWRDTTYFWRVHVLGLGDFSQWLQGKTMHQSMICLAPSCLLCPIGQSPSTSGFHFIIWSRLWLSGNNLERRNDFDQRTQEAWGNPTERPKQGNILNSSSSLSGLSCWDSPWAESKQNHTRDPWMQPLQVSFPLPGTQSRVGKGGDSMETINKSYPAHLFSK